MKHPPKIPSLDELELTPGEWLILRAIGVRTPLTWRRSPGGNAYLSYAVLPGPKMFMRKLVELELAGVLIHHKPTDPYLWSLTPSGWTLVERYAAIFQARIQQEASDAETSQGPGRGREESRSA